MKNKMSISVICMIICMALCVANVIMYSNTMNRLDRIEESLGTVSANKATTSFSGSKADMEMDIEYSTIQLGDAVVTYPSRGIAGKKEEGGRYIEIESIEINKDTPNQPGSSPYKYEYTFTGTHSYSTHIMFSVKQYDEEGFCIGDNQQEVYAAKGERVKNRSEFRIDPRAKSVKIDLLP